MDAHKFTNRRGESAGKPGSGWVRKGIVSVLNTKQDKKSDKRNRRRGAEHGRLSSLRSSNNTHMSFKLMSASN